MLADLSVALDLLGWLFPIGWILIVLAVVPLAALAARYRFRAVLAGVIAGTVTSLLLGGTGLAGNLLGCGVLGAFVGFGIRRGWSAGRTVGVGVVGLWPAVTALVLAALALFSPLRRLALAQVVNEWHGARGLLRHAGLVGAVHAGNHVMTWLVVHWPVPVAFGLLVMGVVSVWLAYGLAVPVVDHLRRVAPTEPAYGLGGDGPVGAVPVALEDVAFRYPGAVADALAGVSLRVGPGDLVAVTGPNGSGKSTLTRILAGAPPTAGTVDRAGSAGPGRPGGTAVIFQHPERQVLGVRVRDDVVWGLPSDHPVDVPSLLTRVGLRGFANRETSTLSGGELQRLAMAAALAREPALLLSDEATAMVDPEGRRVVMRLLNQAARSGTAVVHVTHRPEEADGASRVLALGTTSTPPAPTSRPRLARGGTVRFERVGHVYGEGTPWAHRALHDVDLTVGAGEGILVVGKNGSGKSTLAWVMAGLIVPSEGAAWLGDEPLDHCVGRVGLSFQHARLQLMRSRVRDDVQAASGAGARGADAALELVGLDPAEFADRRVDELSGGEQRRVALAGILAVRPAVLVLDEPFAGMDAAGRNGLLDVLGRLRAETGTTVVMVSHDTEGVDAVIDRMVELVDGTVARPGCAGRRPSATSGPHSATAGPQLAASEPHPAAAGPSSQGPSDGAAPTLRRGRGSRLNRELHLLRQVPGDTFVHRLWAGTKLLVLVAIAVTLSFEPKWAAVGIMAAFLGAGIALARIPWGAVPRLPRWFWIGIGLGAVLPLLAGGRPEVHLAGASVGLGALGVWVRLVVLALVVLAGAALVSWTTPLGEVAPALRRLGAPLLRVRLPVHEWATAVALGLRCVPLLLDEVRILGAVTRLRAPYRPRERHVLSWARLPADLLVAAMVAAIRRAGDMGAAMEARGGLTPRTGADRPGRPTGAGRISDDDARAGRWDALVLALTAAAVAGAVLL